MSTKTKKPKAVTRDMAVAMVAAPLPPECKGLLTRSDVAALLRISVAQLKKMLSAGEYPPPDMRIGVLPRWSVETHNTWLRKRLEEARGGLRQQATV